MLLIGVFHNIGLIPSIRPAYPPDWHLHRDDERFMGWVEQFGCRVDEPSSGDVALFRFGRAASHAGILETPDTMIHADMNAGKVERCEVRRWPDRLVGYWRVR